MKNSKPPSRSDKRHQKSSKRTPTTNRIEITVDLRLRKKLDRNARANKLSRDAFVREFLDGNLE